jgi:hypothetical protein
MQPEALVDIEALSKSPQVNLPVRKLRSLWLEHKIPGLKIGHRTLLFSPSKVRAALERFEIKAVGMK